MKEKSLIIKRKRITTAVAAMMIIAIIAGSLAYWNQTHVIDNPFETGGKFGVTVTEEFKPDGEWLPGVEVKKDVQVKNTGKQDIILRVKMDEKWVRKGETAPYKEFFAEPSKDVYKINQVSEEDGKTTADNSVVIKNFSNSSNWVDGEDGWFYYKVNLAKGTTTDKWLESVELINNLDVGAQEIIYSVATDAEVDNETVWTRYYPENGMPKVIEGEKVHHNKTEVVYKTDGDNKELIGYLDSKYTLSITTQTVQASKEAVMTMFELDEDKVAALEVDWNFAE